MAERAVDRQRGRNYARRGQVISLEIDAGAVTATVQGSRARPYRVRIGIAAFGKAEWAAVEEALAGNAWFVASLLAGQMPADNSTMTLSGFLPGVDASGRTCWAECMRPTAATMGVPCAPDRCARQLL